MLAILSKDAPNNPTDVARCTECGAIYPMLTTDDGDLYPAGTDGVCRCGHDVFRVINQ